MLFCGFIFIFLLTETTANCLNGCGVDFSQTCSVTDGEYSASTADCTKYYRCVHNSWTENSCPSGLKYNPEKCACDHDSPSCNYICPSTISSVKDSPTSTSTGSILAGTTYSSVLHSTKYLSLEILICNISISYISDSVTGFSVASHNITESMILGMSPIKYIVQDLAHQVCTAFGKSLTTLHGDMAYNMLKGCFTPN